MFPLGRVGAALFVFRVSVAASLLIDGASRWAFVNSFWIALVLAGMAIFLCLGFLTPYASLISIVLQVTLLISHGGADGRHLACSIVNCGVLTVLGPGAYSLDARLFGRRLLTFRPRPIEDAQ